MNFMSNSTSLLGITGGLCRRSSKTFAHSIDNVYSSRKTVLRASNGLNASLAGKEYHKQSGKNNERSSTIIDSERENFEHLSI